MSSTISRGSSDGSDDEDDRGTTRTERDRVATSIRLHTPVSDRLFDRFLPREARAVSAMYWSPLAAAVLAARWFDEVGARTVLDIGSGAGKFCVAAALASKARYVGVEHREHLVHAARGLAQHFQLGDRATFLHQPFASDIAVHADAYYLYNPFGENLFGSPQQLDASVELGDARYLRDVELAEELLRNAAIGTHLITFSGFGGLVPRTYSEVRVDWSLTSILRMWKKTSEATDP
jgi:SAM-dependent methyltransferase